MHQHRFIRCQNIAFTSLTMDTQTNGQAQNTMPLPDRVSAVGKFDNGYTDKWTSSEHDAANRILLASALSSMCIICPNRVSRRSVSLTMDTQTNGQAQNTMPLPDRVWPGGRKHKNTETTKLLTPTLIWPTASCACSIRRAFDGLHSEAIFVEPR